MRQTSRIALGAEFGGTAVLTCVVIASGQLATRLTSITALQLLLNGMAAVLVLGLLIWILGPLSGAHFNVAVTIAMRVRGALTTARAAQYAFAQIAGAILGAVIANLMFDRTPISISGTQRGGLGQLIGEVIATAGLLIVICVSVDRGAVNLIPVAVPAWIAGACLFTSSTALANPAVTIGRVFSNSFAGIAPASVTAFICAQTAGALLGLIAARTLSPAQEEAHVIAQR